MKALFFFLCLILIFEVEAFEQRPYLVFLKPETVLIKLSDKKEYRLKHGIYANVLETDFAKRDDFIVYDKSGKPAYSTNSWGVVEIKKDVQLLPEIDAESIYPTPSVFKSNNVSASFDTQFNFHLDSFATPSSDFKSTTMAPRLEIRTLYNSTLPVNFGFTANYQTANWKSELDSLSLTAFSFGPYLQHYVCVEEKFAVSLLMGAEYAPLYTTTSTLDKEKYTAVILDIGSEILWNSDYGKWSLGVHYRRHDLKLDSTAQAVSSPVPENIMLNSIGGMIGYKYEWDL